MEPSPPSISFTTFSFGRFEFVIVQVFDSSFWTVTCPAASQSPLKLTTQSEGFTGVEPSPSVSDTVWAPAETENGPALVPAAPVLVALSSFVAPSTFTSNASVVPLPPTIFLTTVS